MEIDKLRGGRRSNRITNSSNCARPGAGVSAAVSPSLALASGLAFFSSELADFLVYTPLLRRGWLVAFVVVSLLVGILAGSLFLFAYSWPETPPL